MSCGGYPTCKLATNLPYLKEPHRYTAHFNREFGNLMKRALMCRLVGLHRITWRATCSALTNVDAVADGLAWLVGDDEAVTLDRSTSYHGPDIVLIEASMKKKKAALLSLARLGQANLQRLDEELDLRLDEQHVLHFRLDMNRFINGEMTLAEVASTGQIKGQAKIEVYPGQSAQEQVRLCLQEAAEFAGTLP